jgi:hypothetical protein
MPQKLITFAEMLRKLLPCLLLQDVALALGDAVPELAFSLM